MMVRWDWRRERLREGLAGELQESAVVEADGPGGVFLLDGGG